MNDISTYLDFIVIGLKHIPHTGSPYSDNIHRHLDPRLRPLRWPPKNSVWPDPRGGISGKAVPEPDWTVADGDTVRERRMADYQRGLSGWITQGKKYTCAPLPQRKKYLSITGKTTGSFMNSTTTLGEYLIYKFLDYLIRVKKFLPKLSAP